MKTTLIPKSGATATPQPTNNAAADARARAISKINGANAQNQVPNQSPVANPTQVAPEEISAISSGQNTSNVADTTQQADDVVETTTQVIPEAPKEDPASSQLAVIARKERALRAKVQQQDQQLKAREEALKAREAAIAAKDQEYQSGYISKARLKQQTLEALAEAGLSYDEITQKQIDAGSVHPQVKHLIDSLQSEIKELKAQGDNNRKAQEEAQTVQYQQALKQIRSDALDLVNSEPETYEAIRATGSVREVVKLIEETFKEEGRVLSVEEASLAVEEELAERAYKLSELKKVQKRRQLASTAKTTQTQSPTVPKQSQPMKTLTNATSSSRQLNSRERALLAFKGELKS